MPFITSNISEVLGDLGDKIRSLQHPDLLLREIATSMQAVVRDRVHTDGIASDGSQIGTYSKEYMSVRTGQFATNKKVAKGKKKGELRTEGTFTRGIHKGEQRPMYNRTSDTKVIGSLTRQMESDWSAQPTPTGYGLGYNNIENFNKSQYLEATYKKKIWPLTNNEEDNVLLIADNYTDKLLNG